MKIINILIIGFFFLFSFSLSAQMWNGVDTLYGNEWIDFDQSHYKIKVAEDGIFRVSYQTLANQGIPVNFIQGNQLQLFYMGQEVPIHISSNNTLGANDYIEFYGKKNRSQLDKYLFENPEEEMANPEYSLFTDTSAYFLTWNTSTSNNRFTNTPNTIPSNPTFETHCFDTTSVIFTETLSKKLHNNEVFSSKFEVSEGFVSPFELSHTITVTPPNIFLNGPNSILSVRYATAFNHGIGTHEKVVKVNGETLATQNFNQAVVNQHDFELNSSSLATVEVNIDGVFNDRDRQGIAFAVLKYPRTCDFEGNESFKFSMPAANATQYLKITNFSSGSAAPVLYDVTNNLRIVTTIDGNDVKVALPSSTIERELILVNTSTGISEVSDIKPIDFIDYNQKDAEFIIISHPYFYNDASGTNWVQEYANYRSNNYVTEIVDIQQLFDQFAYGINRHSISIRNFGHFIKETWTNPKYVFIIGKGRAYNEIRTTQTLAEAQSINSFFIPSFGTSFGAADNLLLTNPLNPAPIIPIGRLPARTPNDVRIYLDKVIAHENVSNVSQTIADKSWRKKAVHLGGGSPSEQPIFRNYLNGFKTIFETSKIGGQVTSFFKQTSDPIQISQSDQLKNVIDNGISILTFLGHSSAGVFDYSIDDASTYNNEGRYPLIFSFGCFSGRIHSAEIGISEDFVLTESKGAIAFFASTSTAFPYELNTYGTEFYTLLGSSMYSAGIGDISRTAINNKIPFYQFLPEQMTLNGDPSIRINPGPGPDYVVDETSVVFSPNPISIQRESFDVSFDVVNIGQNLSDTIVVEVTQKLPNGTIATLVTDSVDALGFRTKLNYTFSTLGTDALGANQFFIEIDKGNSVAELPLPDAESNNFLLNASGTQGVTVHFISNEVIPVYPEEFGIVNNPNLTLKASTSNTFSEFQKYILEIDTTNLFNSPLKIRKEISQSGGVVKWKPEIPYSNNTVYYWRISPEEDPDVGGYLWRNSSFLYLAGSDEGWNQSHFFQYEKDRYSNIELDDDRNFKFITDFKELSVDNFAFQPSANGNLIYPFYYLNSHTIDGYPGFFDGVFIIVLDSLTIEPWHNPNGGDFGSINGGPDDIYSFMYRTQTPAQRAKVINMLENEIPDGHYVCIYTVQRIDGNYEPNEWASDSATLGTDIFTVLENQGATQVRNLETIGSVPYLFFYQKGSGPLGEEITAEATDRIDFNYAIPGSWDEGFIESTTIGPAQEWKTLEWNTSSLDGIPTDDFGIDVIGIGTNGSDSLLISNIQNTSESLANINAIEFPFLKLRFNSMDTIQKSSIHLEHWRVLYKGIPEIALNPNSHFSFYNDTLEQGEPLLMEVGLENIGRYDMDSILVKYTITNSSNQQDSIVKRIAPLIVNDTLIVQLEFDTKDLAARNTISIEANPNEDQLEQFHFNNVGFFDFYVNADKRNPILDVTFDGFHIMDGDVVSSKPNIMITLNDENEFLPLNDTSLVKVFLQSPGNPIVVPINIDGDTLSFFPAVPNSDNKARLEFKPHLLQDGTYTLIVQAEDASGNQSGNLDYKVTFKVTNKSAISNVLNYPNPFSTSTKFVFTITGDEIPENMKIQIMTISGKIVREITQAELGPIHVGNNITEFSWNGTDEFGDKLANGVYLYRVVAQKVNGDSYDSFNTKADQFFKNGFGKMVILR